MQVVESGSKNIEICVIRGDKKREFLSGEYIASVVAAIEAEEVPAAAEAKTQ
jgi:hypothetical protein